MILLNILFEDGLKKIEKQHKLHDEKEFSGEFDAICVLFDIPKSRFDNYSLQVENPNTGTYYFRNSKLSPSFFKDKEVCIS